MRRLVLTISLAVCATAAAFAHGVDCAVQKTDDAVLLICTYEGDIAVGAALVSVFTPSEPDEKWQSGETDRNGIFAFVPSETGSWRVIVDDGTGHRTEFRIAVDNAVVTMERPAGGPGPIQMIYKVIFGLALIIGATGLFYGLKARRQ